MRNYDQPASGQKRLVLTDNAVLQSAICDGCGADLIKMFGERLDQARKHFQERTEVIGAISELGAHTIDSAGFDYDAGFHSPWDGDHWHADLCPDCALKVKDLINQGPGPGVQTQTDQWEPSMDESWAVYAPFSDPQISTYQGEQYCVYHKQQRLVLKTDGLVCPLDYCDLNYSYVDKSSFAEADDES